MRPSRCDLGRGNCWAIKAPAAAHTASTRQESISDFYWYYSGKDVIEEQGKRNFSKAMSVAKQVFNSLTEYIQVGFASLGEAGQSRTLAPYLVLTRTLPPRAPALGTSRV